MANLRSPEFTRYRRALLRGWYKLLLALLVLCIVVAVSVAVSVFLWKDASRGKVYEDDVTATHLHDVSNDTRAILSATDIEGRYDLYNRKLDELSSRGALSAVTARDAKRTKDIFREANDDWTPVPMQVQSSSPAFNPKVTLSGQ